MKSLCFAALFAACLAGCASTSPHASLPASRPVASGTFGPLLAEGVKSASSASQGPRIAVGTRYADEPLNLPWFLNDAIDAANGR
ncbi:MAG: hypothetical protein ACTHJ1_09530 [Bordetella sp.]|uniref:hypothetical protein n=1 Tax=Bordetella sp. TaxID=28081 RepID=UPI003F7C5814